MPTDKPITTPITSVLWDFGGVLTESPFDAFRRYEQENGLPTDFLRSVNTHKPDANAWAQFERNEIDLDTFDGAFREESGALGHAVGGRDVVKLLSGALRPEMVEALRRCSERLKCGCITNNVAAGQGRTMSGSATLAGQVEQVFALFDVIIESSKIGLRKPDPKIYKLACERLDVQPDETAYLDDLGINLKPARALGMTTIKVSDPDDALLALEKAVGFSLR
jgi:putative hydrolase of the HAD superfamily